MTQEIQVTAGMLDFPRKKLPDDVWLYEENRPLPRLQPKLRSAILSEGRYRLKKFGAKLKGAMLYGGAATYQYHEGGDIDVSLYIDWDDFKGDEEILQDAFKSVVIPWGKYELHLFVKPSNQQEQVEVADAYYNVMKDEWELPPLILPKDFDPEVFFQPMVEMAEQKAERIDFLLGKVGREWSRLKKCLRALEEGARDEHVVRERAYQTKAILLDWIEVLCDEFVAIWKARKKLHDQLRQRFVTDRNVGRYERFQYPEVCWKYLDEMGYVEYLKVLAKAQEAGVINTLLDEALPKGEADGPTGD
jgi:predicted nucleotidyltransferase